MSGQTVHGASRTGGKASLPTTVDLLAQPLYHLYCFDHLRHRFLMRPLRYSEAWTPRSSGMTDLYFIVLGTAIFAGLALYAYACDRL